jgi:Mg2+ and Co2+ transporter CorA
MFHDNPDGELEYEHISFVLANESVISIQEIPKDIFDLICECLTKSRRKIRKKGQIIYSIVLSTP